VSPRAVLYGPQLVQIVVTRRCNIDCGYCNEYDKTSEPIPADNIRRYVDKLAELGCMNVEYTGGETLLHPELPALVRYASEYRFLERWIITNGYLLTEAVIDQLNEAGLTHLQISIDGVKPTATTVKTLQPLQKKLELLARHAAFKVQVSAVLGATNAGEAIEVLRVVRELGFRPRVSVLHDGRGALALDEQSRELLRKLNETGGKRWRESRDYRTRLLVDGRAEFKCRAGARYLYVDEFGLVNWCSQQRGVFTKPLLEYTEDDLREQFYVQKDCAPTCTVGCVRTASKWDEWRAQPNRQEHPHRTPALNEEALLPVSLLRPRGGPAPKRSQASLRAGK
jgi:MoaA/NifB/PqqE/SkfB family radical SAM enzyme